MRKGIILVVVLLVPSIIYMLFSLGEHNTRKLGFAGPYDVMAEGDTSYLSTPLPRLLTSTSEMVDADHWKGRAVLVHRLTWPCADECMTSLATLNNYLDDIGFAEDWVLLSIAPSRVDNDELSALSSKKIYQFDNWVFAQPDEEYQWEAFLSTSIRQKSGGENLAALPQNVVMLMDQEQRIRATFDLRLQQDNKTLQDAIKMVIQEPHISWKK